jgi:hypothetical protein
MDNKSIYWSARVSCCYYEQGWIQDLKLGGALKKIAPSGGRRENFWGYFV